MRLPEQRGSAELQAGDRLVARVAYELTSAPAADADSQCEALIQPLVELEDLFDYTAEAPDLALVMANGARWPIRLEPIFGAAGDLSCFTYRAIILSGETS
jgi:hypothetical protein